MSNTKKATLSEFNLNSHTLYSPSDTLPKDFPAQLLTSDGKLTGDACKVCGAKGLELNAVPCSEYSLFTLEEKQAMATFFENAARERLHGLLDIAVNITALSNMILQFGFNYIPGATMQYTLRTMLEFELARIQVAVSIMKAGGDVDDLQIHSYLPDAAEAYNSEMRFNSFPVESFNESASS